jgi:hypothetical protein
MRTETTTIYIAEDGMSFSTKAKCEDYEASLRTKNIKDGAVFEDKRGVKVIVVSYCNNTYMLSNNAVSTTIDNPFVLFVNLSDNPKIIGVTKEQMWDYLNIWGYKYVGKVVTNFVKEN